MGDCFNELAVDRPAFSDDKECFRSELMAVLSNIRDELDDHRQAINENTNEVESNFEFLIEISRKVDALSERIDSLSLALSKEEKIESMFKVADLTPTEKRVFSALYIILQGSPETTYQQIALRIGSSSELVAGYITNLVEKGVPIRKRYVSKQARVSLDKRFKDEQAKCNLVRLDVPLTAWF